MATLGFYRGSILAAGLMTVLALVAPPVWAQARRSTPIQPQPEAAVAARDKVTIRKIEGIGSAARIKTPEYTVNVTDFLPVTREWARVTVQFETTAEWTDELEFRYFVQVQNPRTRLERRFPGVFTYVDIPKGKQHYASVFLRPTTIDRHGDILGVAVEVYSRGELVAASAIPEAPAGWWRTATIKESPGVLLERSQTPFAFVAYDAYVTAKPKKAE